MNAKIVSTGFVLFLLACLASGAQEENYLITKCENIMGGDFISSLVVYDVENKGTLNILVGTSYNGVLYNFVYDSPASCYNEWSPKSQIDIDSNIDEIVIEDADGDGKEEIILNGAKTKGITPKNPDAYVSVFTMSGNALLDEWDYDDGDNGCAFTNSVDSSNLYGGTENVILMGTESKKVCAITEWSTKKGVITWVSPVLDYPVKYIEAADFNADGYGEIVVLARQYGAASVYLLNRDGQILWKKEISGGVRTDESKNIWVDDINADGKYEIIVGTQDHGVDVLSSDGKLLWNFETKSSLSKTDIVSKVRTYRYFTGDTTPKVIVAAKPYIYLLDSAGKLIWKSPVNTTVFDFSYGDLDKDGRNELVVGATSYIYVYTESGKLKGTWSYVSEIQGLTGVFKKRDMDTVKISANDFDNDGADEVVAAFKWFDDQLDTNVPQGSLRLFDLNPDYKPSLGDNHLIASTLVTFKTEPTEYSTQATTKPTVATTKPTTVTTVPKTTTEKKKGWCPCLPLLPASLALITVLGLGIPLALRKQ